VPTCLDSLARTGWRWKLRPSRSRPRWEQRLPGAAPVPVCLAGRCRRGGVPGRRVS